MSDQVRQSKMDPELAPMLLNVPDRPVTPSHISGQHHNFVDK